MERAISADSTEFVVDSVVKNQVSVTTEVDVREHHGPPSPPICSV